MTSSRGCVFACSDWSALPKVFISVFQRYAITSVFLWCTPRWPQKAQYWLCAVCPISLYSKRTEAHLCTDSVVWTISSGYPRSTLAPYSSVCDGQLWLWWRTIQLVLSLLAKPNFFFVCQNSVRVLLWTSGLRPALKDYCYCLPSAPTWTTNKQCDFFSKKIVSLRLA